MTGIEPGTVLLAVVDELLPRAEQAVAALGGSILASRPGALAGVTDLQVQLPDTPPSAERLDITLTRESAPGQPSSLRVTQLTFLDAEQWVIETRAVRVTLPITLDQIPEPLRGATHRR